MDIKVKLTETEGVCEVVVLTKKGAKLLTKSARNKHVFNQGDVFNVDQLQLYAVTRISGLKVDMPTQREVRGR